MFDAESFEYLAQKAWPERVMLGSDMPFPIGDPEPRKVIDDSAFSEAQKTDMLGETAQKVFRVRPDARGRA